MSSLGLSLLILALAGIGGVLVYNYWLGGGPRRRGTRIDPEEPEALLRQEPRFGRLDAGPAPGPDLAGLSGLDDDAEPAKEPDEVPAVATHAPADEEEGPPARDDEVMSAQDRILEAHAARAAPSVPPLDPRVDCCVVLVPATPVAGERLAGLARRARRAGSKAILVEAALEAVEADGPRQAMPALRPGATPSAGDQGQEPGAGEAAASPEAPEPVPEEISVPAPARSAVAWESPRPHRRYRSVRLGVLMADRHGPINAMEFAEFTAAAQALADGLVAPVELPDMTEVIDRARELDAFCAALDAQIGVNVDAPEALSPADLAGIARTADLVERGNTRYARLDAQDGLVFSVGLGDTPNRLVFLLDVPRVAASQQPLRAMVACAWHCAQLVEGRMVDDSGRALTDAVFTQIEKQLLARYAALAQAGFEAGSPLALRLFN